MLQMLDQGGTEGRLLGSVNALFESEAEGKAHTLPAPAGPITRVPNLLIVMTSKAYEASRDQNQ